MNEPVDALSRHVPVLTAEVLAALDPRPGQVMVDATLGGGGHARLLAEKLGPTGRLIGLDQDATMVERFRPGVAQPADAPITLVQANFEDLRQILTDLRIEAVDGVLADLGVCSDQLDDANRGFSFSQGGPLDMRLDPERGEAASALLRKLNEHDLADLFYEFGEERYSRRIARKIVEVRRQEPLETTEQLASLVRRCVPRPPGRRKQGIDPATRVFQALRIAVNDELGALERLLKDLPRCVRPGGRAVLISFHSLEDRRVKRAFRQVEVWQAQTKKPVEAGEEEVQRNPRARSAKLRAALRRGPGP
jgi:16S rRNA (cytosine1402-N4)-methyltransferase